MQTLSRSFFRQEQLGWCDKTLLDAQAGCLHCCSTPISTLVWLLCPLQVLGFFFKYGKVSSAQMLGHGVVPNSHAGAVKAHAGSSIGIHLQRTAAG